MIGRQSSHAVPIFAIKLLLNDIIAVDSKYPLGLSIVGFITFFGKEAPQTDTPPATLEVPLRCIPSTDIANFLGLVIGKTLIKVN